jgi:hypothetical protein
VSSATEAARSRPVSTAIQFTHSGPNPGKRLPKGSIGDPANWPLRMFLRHARLLVGSIGPLPSLSEAW